SPGYFQTNKSAGNLSYADMVKAFSSTLTYGTHTSTPDMQLFANYYDSWKLGGSARLFGLTSVTYTKETTDYDVYRQSGNTDAFIANGGDLNIGTTNAVMESGQTTEIGKINVLENLTLKSGRNTTIQFKNFFVNDGRKFTGVNTSRMNILPHYDSVY